MRPAQPVLARKCGASWEGLVDRRCDQRDGCGSSHLMSKLGTRPPPAPPPRTQESSTSPPPIPDSDRHPAPQSVQQVEKVAANVAKAGAAVSLVVSGAETRTDGAQLSPISPKNAETVAAKQDILMLRKQFKADEMQRRRVGF